MQRKNLKNLIFVLAGVLCAELVFAGALWLNRDKGGEATLRTEPTEAQTNAPTQVQETTLPGGEVTEGTTVPVTTVPEETEPAQTEPREQRYVLTFAGDCTLASDSGSYGSAAGFISTIGTDYDYPFRNVAEYFRSDDFTIINLESVLADSGNAAGKLFTFRGPTAYTQIMTGSSVEAVTLANNHTEDFGKTGYDSTTKALSDAGIWYVEKDKTKLLTTESGLTIGLYADSFYFDNKDIEKNVEALKKQGAEIIICAFHWGTEGSYRATADQEAFARAAIDAGADIVYGHHPHVLQRIETYKDGIIFYSLGNFSFGGNHFPRDMDSAVVQQEVIRDVDGSLRLGELTIIPVSISSIKNQNNFQPTPYKEGTEEYDRTLSKLDGTFRGPDLVVNYDHLKPTEPPTEAPTEAPDQGGDHVTEPEESGDEGTPPPTQGGDSSGEQTPPTQGGDSSGEQTPPAEGGDSSGGEQTPPPAEGGDSSGGEQTPPPAEGGDTSGGEQTPPPTEGGDTSGGEQTPPPAEGGDQTPAE